MKVRIGFVSNSSSSSFLMYGARIPESELLDLDVGTAGLVLEYGDPNARWGGSNDTVIVGRSWDSVGDNETGLEFKQNVKAAVEKLFGSGYEFHTMEDAWYNG